jgi:hypothetical protein
MLTLGDDNKPPSKVQAIGADLPFYVGFTFAGLVLAVLSTIPGGAGLAFLVAVPVAWLYIHLHWAGWPLAGFGFFEMLIGFSVGGWLYIYLASRLAAKRRAAAAWIFAITSVPIWGSVALMAASSIFQAPTFDLGGTVSGLMVPVAISAGLIMQFYAALCLSGKVAPPAILSRLSDKLSAAPQNSGTAIGAADSQLMASKLAALKETTDIEQLNVLALECLNSCGLTAGELQASAAEPVPVLLQVLVKQKRHDDAEEVSKHFLHVVEHHSA